MNSSLFYTHFLVFLVVVIGLSYIKQVTENPIPLDITWRYNHSPFVIHDIDRYMDELKDLGVKWVRLSVPEGLVWDADEPMKRIYD